MATSWSYVPNDVYKPADELIEKLVDIVSKGGNFLLNIGPGPDGELDPVAYDRLKEIGNWMKINGEAIYKTRMYKVFGEGNNIRFTQSKDGSTTYIFFFSFPKEPVTLKNLSLGKKCSVKMLGNNTNLKYKILPQGVQLIIPEKLEKAGKHVWVLKVVQK